MILFLKERARAAVCKRRRGLFLFFSYFSRTHALVFNQFQISLKNENNTFFLKNFEVYGHARFYSNTFFCKKSR